MLKVLESETIYFRRRFSRSLAAAARILNLARIHFRFLFLFPAILSWVVWVIFFKKRIQFVFFSNYHRSEASRFIAEKFRCFSSSSVPQFRRSSAFLLSSKNLRYFFRFQPGTMAAAWRNMCSNRSVDAVVGKTRPGPILSPQPIKNIQTTI